MNPVEVTARPWRSLEGGDRAAYRRLVALCPWSTVFHTPEWLDVIVDSFSPEATCLLAGRSGRLTGAFPFFTLPGAGAGYANHSSLRDHDMVYGGPIASPDAPEAGPLPALLDRFESGPRTLASYLLPPPGFPAEVLASRGYRMTHHLTAAIDLTRPADRIWAGVHPKTRNMISKARRSGLSVREATEEDLLALPEMIAAAFRRAGARPPDRGWILNVSRALGAAGLARVLVAVGGGPNGPGPVAGAIFLRHLGRSYYWAGGAVDEGYETSASHLVQWEGIEAARAQGCVEHDLVMVDPVAAPGIARFKLRFGARVVPLWTASRRRLTGRLFGRTLKAAGRLATALTAPVSWEGRLAASRTSAAPDGRRR